MCAHVHELDSTGYLERRWGRSWTFRNHRSTPDLSQTAQSHDAIVAAVRALELPCGIARLCACVRACVRISVRGWMDGCTFAVAHAALHLQPWRIICVRRKLGFLTGSAARVALDLPMSVAWTTAHAAMPPALVARPQLGRERNLQRQARRIKQPMQPSLKQ